MSPRPIRPLVAGNWKMNGSRASGDLVRAIGDAYDEALRARVELLVCPPAILLHPLAEHARAHGLALGGQDHHPEAAGAYTGDHAAEMLHDAGASYAILGHSERRDIHRESDALVLAKVLAAMRAGLAPIVCVGETREEREGGRAEAVVAGQLAGSLPDAPPPGLAVAYEPVWAIGTGLTPTVDEIAAMHDVLRAGLDARYGEAGRGVRLLYGGSVKASNAAEIAAVPEVNGALVGGASLDPAAFLAIARAFG